MFRGNLRGLRALAGRAGSLLVVGDGTTRNQFRKNAGDVIERAAKVLGNEERPLLAAAVIRDHGGGFETDEPAGEGLGLRSMEERASLLGRTFSLGLGPDPEGGAEVRPPPVKGEDA